MSNIENIAVILIDPYNDFPHHDGKMYELVRDSIKATDTVVHLKELVTIARAAKIPIFYGLHQQHHAGHYDGWKHMGLTHPSLKAGKVFEEGSWCRVLRGLEPQLSNGDVVVSKHWNSSSFANTDLDYQLKQRDITNVVIAGLISETCFESTARYAYELTDTTTGVTTASKDAATTLIWPFLAQKVMTVGVWAATLGLQ